MFSRHISRRNISFFKWNKKDQEKVTTNEVTDTNDVNEFLETQSIWEHLDQEEIDRICDRSNMISKDREKYYSHLNEPRRFNRIHQYKTEYVRSFYAKYGRSSGLKPGVCWPRKEELAFKKQYEATFYPSLNKLMQDHSKQVMLEQKEIKDRDAEITKNLKKLDKEIEAFKKKYYGVKAEQKEAKLLKEKQVHDVREYLGYSIDPRDPRFREALIRKQEEEKEESKGIQKKSKQMKLIEEMQKLIDSASDSTKNEPQPEKIKTKI